MNPAFREYVTSTAFNLTLCKTHISALSAIANNNRDAGVNMGLFVPAVNGLIRRGLVIHHMPEKLEFKPFNQVFEITRAGELVLDLLREAGIINEQQESEAA